MTGFGLIQVYTGNGKGKTTASLGLAFRACGHNLNVCMIQFMKGDNNYGEVKAAKFLPTFTFIQTGRENFVNLSNPDPADIKAAQEGWELAQSEITSGKYHIVILDEINVAMASNLIDTNSVVAFLRDNQKRGTEIILTGRYAPQEIIEIAHLVTEMREVRHPYMDNVPARQGIDY